MKLSCQHVGQIVLRLNQAIKKWIHSTWNSALSRLVAGKGFSRFDGAAGTYTTATYCNSLIYQSSSGFYSRTRYHMNHIMIEFVDLFEFNPWHFQTHERWETLADSYQDTSHKCGTFLDTKFFLPSF